MNGRGKENSLHTQPKEKEVDILKQEKGSLWDELEFFEKTGNKNKNIRYAGVLTTTDFRAITILYPQIIKGVLLLYNYLERPVEQRTREVFLRKYLLSQFYNGVLLSDEEVAGIKDRLMGGKYSQQLLAYSNRGTPILKSSTTQAEHSAAEEEQLFELLLPKKDANKDHLSGYRKIQLPKDVLYNKGVILSHMLALHAHLVSIFGEVDYKRALATELLFSAPFVESVVTGETITPDGQNRHQAYLQEMFGFANKFDPGRHFEAFNQLTKEYPVEWTDEVKTHKMPEFDKSYILKVYEYIDTLLEGKGSIKDVYEFLRQTVLKRGKLFKTVEVETFMGTYVTLAPTEVPTTPFDNIGGYEKQKSFLQTLLTKVVRNDAVVETLRVVISAGRPGVGKSLGVNAFLSNLPENAKGIIVEITQSMTRGMTSQQDVLIELARLHPDLQIFAILEDMDTIAGDRLLNHFTREFLKIDSVATGDFPTNLHIIGTTNRIDKIDPAVLRPGRASKILVYDVPKEESTRKEIARIQSRLNGLQFSEETLNLIASKTNGLTPDEIRHIIWSLKFDNIEDPTQEDVERFINEVKMRHELENSDNR